MLWLRSNVFLRNIHENLSQINFGYVVRDFASKITLGELNYLYIIGRNPGTLYVDFCFKKTFKSNYKDTTIEWKICVKLKLIDKAFIY